MAIGSSRARVIADVLKETTLLTLAGGLCGLAVGAFAIRMLALLGADRLPLGAHIVVDARLALIALAGTIFMELIMGIPIAWLSVSSRLSDALQSQCRTGTAGRFLQQLRHVFVVAQIAGVVILVTLLACLVPSRRAARTSPIDVLY